MKIMFYENVGFGTIFKDIGDTFRKNHIVFTLGWEDIAMRYRRSKVGVFWLTISMSVTIGAIGLVFGLIFKQPMEEYLPYLTVSLIVWGFLSSLLSEGSLAFIAATGMILQIRMPLFVFILRVLWRNAIIFFHNLVILPIVLLLFLKPIGIVVLVFIPGLILFAFNATWMMLILAVVCTRYRDLTQIVSNVVNVIFYITPIMWNKNLFPEQTAYLFALNPFYHLIQIVRLPLLGEAPTLYNWLICIAMGIIGWGLGLFLYSKYYHRITYWL